MGKKGGVVMGKNFRDTLNEQMKDKNFKKEYDNLGPEYQLIKAMVKSRDEKHLTQKQLSDITGIAQSEISKYENGLGNPSLDTIERIAKGMGKKLKLEFI